MTQGPPTIAGRYQLTKKLGRRALGDSFGGKDLQLERSVLVETLSGPPLKAGAKLSPAAIQTLKRDLEALAQIQDSHLLQILELDFQHRPPVLVFEPPKGENLVLWRQKHAPAPAKLPELLEDLSQQLLSALGALHRQGLVHKDLRPSNVSYSEAGTCLLLEPGIELSGGNLQALHPSIGSQILPFQSPEVLRGEPATQASDLYQLGALLRFVATGKPIYSSSEEALQAASERRPLASIRTQLPDLREAWIHFLDELVSDSVETRIQSVAAAEEFLQIILLEDAAVEAGAQAGGGLPPPPDPSQTSWKVPAALAGVGLLAAAAFPFLASSTPKGPEVLVRPVYYEGSEELRAVFWLAEGSEVAPETITLEVLGPEETPLSLGLNDLSKAGAEVLRSKTKGLPASSSSRPPDQPALAGYSADLPYAKIAGHNYRLSHQDQVLGEGVFPGNYRPLSPAVDLEASPDGGLRVQIRTLTPVRVELSGKGASYEGKLALEHAIPLTLPDQGALEGLTWKVEDGLGKALSLEGLPAKVLGHLEFYGEAKSKLQSLVPDPVKDSLKGLVQGSLETAKTSALEGWDQVQKSWSEDPTFHRLRAHAGYLLERGDLFPIEKRIGFLYTLWSLERVNSAVVSLTNRRPLPTRELSEPWVRFFETDGLDPAEAEAAKVLLEPGTGPIMFQYSSPPPSWINENGKKRWPSQLENPFALPPEWRKSPGTRLRFLVEVEDVSPLYRVELEFRLGSAQDGDWRTFELYPRRNMVELTEKKGAEKKQVLGLELPLELVPENVSSFRFKIQRLGSWGGHGATTLHRVLLQRVSGP